MGAGDTSQVQRVKLGSTNIEISELGFGTIAWGDTSRGFGTKYTDPMLEQVGPPSLLPCEAKSGADVRLTTPRRFGSS